MSAPSRDPWLDNAKMVLVTLVVVGHSFGLFHGTDETRRVYDFLYFWHIPAFVFISGYLSKSFTWSRPKLANLVQTLLIPYLIFEPALVLYRRALGEDPQRLLWIEPNWAMWYLIVLVGWRLLTPVLKAHWIMLPLSVVVSLLGGWWDSDLLMLPRLLGLLPFFTLGLWLRADHLKRLDDWVVRVAAVVAMYGLWYIAPYTDEWTRTALLWYDAGYEGIELDPLIGFQARLAVMGLGLVGTFSVLALVPRRSLGWFTSMGSATLVVYLFHGFVVKTVLWAGYPEFSEAHPELAFRLALVGAVCVALLLASPPVRKVLGPLTDPVGSVRRWRARSSASAS
ncbi:MAG: acyltransferase family protein [Nocardioides sp.]|uniref:acyltransferase family protein n=1 Tax=Nocardioides sp. TaxID=35761 RepID=UPI003F05B002